MIRHIACVVGVALLLAGPAAKAQERAAGVPAHRLLLEFDKEQYLLGENVVGHFVVENTGAAPFRIEIGGDYRGASRELRFKVTATDEKGNVAADPDSSGFNMGGLSGNVEVKPGERWVRSLPLLKYVRIDEPGTYTIRVTHDLGWKGAAEQVKTAEGVAKFVRPDENEAARLVMEMEQMPARREDQWGQKSAAWANYSVLRHPAYLKPLAERAEAGAQGAVDGIAGIETKEATGELVKLLGHVDAKLRRRAAQVLLHRLPDPRAEAGLAAGPDPLHQRRMELAKRTWDAGLAAKVMEHARKLLATEAAGDVSVGAYMTYCLGGKEDRGAVIEALERVLGRAEARKDEKANILDGPAGVRDLLRALDSLHDRGAAPAAEPKSAAEVLAYLEAVRVRKDFRPAGWEPRCVAALKHPVAYVRETAVRCLPAPIPPGARETIAAAFADEDLGVRRAACELVAGAKDGAFREQVLRTVGETRHVWVINAANNAAVALGLRYEAAVIWAERLDEPGMLTEAITFLAGIVKYPGQGTGANSNVGAEEVAGIKKQWKAFLAAHGEEIRRGRLFEIGEPALRAELFAPVFHFYLKDGVTQWPRGK